MKKWVSYIRPSIINWFQFNLQKIVSIRLNFLFFKYCVFIKLSSTFWSFKFLKSKYFIFFYPTKNNEEFLVAINHELITT